ncbi:hypothetical protein [Vibrio sp. vnigr-6D03]|uniref:hypothetical protein n=1 Tax=Vibrio sp. vnigr-6D03 TaxID=2058088 RepID=UPI0015E0EE3A|nr:hypothetical protein [Vibrio sp. vnigr-6D03]
MNNILANKTFCNQTTELKTPTRSENLEEQAKSEDSKYDDLNELGNPKATWLAAAFPL